MCPSFIYRNDKMIYYSKPLRNLLKKPKYLRLWSSATFPDIDVDYFCNAANTTEIQENISLRKRVGNIERVLETYNIFKQTPATDQSYKVLKESLFKELCNLPNKTHPLVKNYKDDPRLVREINKRRDFGINTPLEFSEITRRLNLMRTDKLGQTCGHKSYYFLGELAELEEALIKYTVTMLLKKNFQLVSVPDILPSHVLESCGMSINNDRTQVKNGLISLIYVIPSNKNISIDFIDHTYKKYLFAHHLCNIKPLTAEKIAMKLW